MQEKLKMIFAGRPLWMNCLMVFCAYMTFIYMPFDIFWKPVEGDEEVWFGYMLHGWAAKATAPIHWLIYGFGCYGFYRMKSWMWPWASLYVFQVAIGMLVWSMLYGNQDMNLPAMLAAVLVVTLFVVLGVMLWRARSTFRQG